MSNQKMQMKNTAEIISTKIELTERNMQTLKRDFEIDLYKTHLLFVNLFKLEESKRDICFFEATCENENDMLIYNSHILYDFNPFYMTIEITKRHCKYFNDNGECDLDEGDCKYCRYDCMNQFKVKGILKYLGRKLKEFNLTCQQTGTELIDDSFFEFIWGKLENEINIPYKFCKCGDQCFKHYDQCEGCYTYNYINEDNCSICMENHYVWCELACGHKFHTACIRKVESKKCPLCRAKFVMIKQI